MAPPENGNDTLGIRRFAAAAIRNTRRMRIFRQENEPPSTEETLAIAMAPWTRERVCQEFFLPWLEQEIAEAEADTAKHIASHPNLCYAKGQEDRLKLLKLQFLVWSGQAYPGPGQGG